LQIAFAAVVLSDFWASPVLQSLNHFSTAVSPQPALVRVPSFYGLHAISLKRSQSVSHPDVRAVVFPFQ
jgi:hypothetical protein